MDYRELTNRYPSFTYEGYTTTENQRELTVVYAFSIDGLAAFSPRWVIPKLDATPVLNDPFADELIFSLGMAELVSYWKPTCSARVRILPRRLNTWQIDWWKKLYFNGLGEFFYQNGMQADFKTFMTIDCADAPEPPVFSAAAKPLRGALIPIGGGKDSIVTLELLRDRAQDNIGFQINRRSSSEAAAKLAGLPSMVSPVRTLDPELLALNKRGFLNGHTPFSSIVAFSSVLCAYLYGRRDVVLSNESSANEPTVPDSTVNHQYSKSAEFERDFTAYIAQHIPCGVRYFSLLRPLSEFQIAALFARYPDYHPVFRSCNRGSKTDTWCGACPKCLFVYIILSPFLAPAALRAIFGRDLLDDAALLNILRELSGQSAVKPFECIGSRDEVNTALCLTIERYRAAGEPLPALLRDYAESPLYAVNRGAPNRWFFFFDRDNLLPPEYAAILENAYRSLLDEHPTA